ncbi:MAG: glycosyltransferase [Prolixibacteraceae bacterium]|nr:glycosyltransferase [Prolixibacteraceae bacterium]
MSKANKIKVPSKQEKITSRLMILLGLFSFANFFYWFLDPTLIEAQFLFWLLVVSIAYDTLKIFYIWYHYWDISVPSKPILTKEFTVDVFTTYFPGEPYEMIKETLLAIQKIKYPHTTYLCDEANDQYLKAFCEENNILHVTRNNRINAKAGNINNALLQAKGDICLILDPDHLPLDNFLEEVIPYFEDEAIGFVQTVQAYYNIKESYVAKGAAEQTFHFYGPVMMSMNSYGTVNAIGANCVFRRTALDSIGGHAAGLSEDMHTAMQLHAKGWKSVYVPEVFTKGLVPASLTAYYKQQLKWSRGTIELLVAVFPKLFRKFTWRQKIHYGILPFHYLSGISYLISFLIPIISLFTATTPWKGNVVNFGLIFTPILVSILGIRFYAQRWVMYKSERGIHLTGGLLQTCTWWIFIIGFVYTIIRKKVPYLPTPKEDKESTSWKILIPNLFVGVISIIAVIYGLSIDLTPFSIFMSGFALLNASFMFYTLIFAYQKQKAVSLNFNSAEGSHISIVDKLQNFSFQVWRKTALPVIIFVLFTSMLIQQGIEYGKWGGVKPEVQNKHVINYLGIFEPKNDNGITNLRNVKEISKQIDENFDIISLYIAWKKNIEPNFPQSLLDSIYIQKSIPMITWEPWLNTFESELKSNKHVFELIAEGYFDNYLASFAEKLKNLQRPVFLRFAHEFDNPFYPWYVSGEDGEVKFKKAWTHTYEIFKDIEANNVIWIWNPWKPENVASFYPGKEYVDWIGVNVLNYGSLNQDGKGHAFKDLYEPFHNELSNLPSTPVIISEFGTLKENQKQEEWLVNAFTSIENEYREIKSVIYFNSKVDNNWPKGLQMKESLDWTISKKQVVKNSFRSKEVPDYVFSPLPDFKSSSKGMLNKGNEKLKNIYGINLKKGNDWRKDYHVLSRKNLLIDFAKIKRLGINTIKFEGNSVYDYNVLNIAKELNLNVSFGFWIPADIDFVNDTMKTELLKQTILEEIAEYKEYVNISSWNIQNDVQYNQKDFYLKPRILYQNRAYVIWLNDLVQEIKKIDSIRPLIVDMEVNRQSIYHSKVLMQHVKGIDALGLVVKNDKHLDPLHNYFKNSKTEFLYSEIRVPILTQSEIFSTKTSFFITAWQDQHESNKLTFDGIIDRKGRYKTDYFELLNAMQNSNVKIESPKVRILKPATLIVEGKVLGYYAMYHDSIAGWKHGAEKKDLSFEWSMVKCDIHGNYLAIKDIGIGDTISITIPEENELYKLLLTTFKGKVISNTTITELNTPFLQKKDINE